MANKPKKKQSYSKPKKPKTFKPSNYLRGSTTPGGKYTAFTNYGQGRPDFGKGAGPGTPYREVTRVNPGRNYTEWPDWEPPASKTGTYSRPRSGTLTRDPRTSAIRRRLGWI